jgi:hypothetical protein
VNKYLATLALLFLITGCQTNPNKPAGETGPVPTTLQFIDLDGFDTDLKRALDAGSKEVTVNFIARPSPNKTPERLQKWVAKMRETGGTVEIESPANELAPKNPFALFGLIGSLWSGTTAVKEMSKAFGFDAIKGRNAIIRLERNAKQELVIGQVVFIAP